MLVEARQVNALINMGISPYLSDLLSYYSN